MSKDDDDAQSTVEAYDRAWTSGNVDRALTYLSDDVRCFAPDADVTTKTDWQEYLSGFVPMPTCTPERLGYVPREQQPT